jgi:hypothetical protein
MKKRERHAYLENVLDDTFPLMGLFSLKIPILSVIIIT